jgi:DNA phosphorothioation-associated putative methyltransferase
MIQADTVSPQDSAYKTAMHRKVASVPGKYAIETLQPKLKFKNILDWGCGRGMDVSYFNEQGLKAEGFDPHFSPDMPTGTYDFVTCSYVLNVIDKVSERKKCLTNIWWKLNTDGHALITIRPHMEIYKQAHGYYLAKKNKMRKDSWRIHTDGFITTRGTFQTLMNAPALCRLIKGCGFEVKHQVDNTRTVMVLAQKV